MDGRRREGNGQRAAMAVLALYALLLQSFLAAAAPIGPGPAGVDLCRPMGGRAPLPGHDPGGSPHLACCLAACPAGAGGPAPLAFVNLVPPPRATHAVAFAPAATAPIGAAPAAAWRARGPPSA